nr:MAG TPA: hypothetical protein [Caudoviricetes sp.]
MIVLSFNARNTEAIVKTSPSPRRAFFLSPAGPIPFIRVP